jgi:hypothetical protein
MDKMKRTIIIGILFLTSLMLSVSCGTTKIEAKEKPIHKCELMEQGQKCLPDHSCCKK